MQPLLLPLYRHRTHLICKISRRNVVNKYLLSHIWNLAVLISFYSQNFLFFIAEARAIMLPMVINQLILYLEKMEDLQICIDIMNDLLAALTRPPEEVVSS